MTTPDPFSGSSPSPDDAASGFDTQAAGAGVGAPPPPQPPPTGPVPPAGQLPPAGEVPPSGDVPPAGQVRSTPPGLVAGMILVIIGAVFLVGRVVDVSLGAVTWPLWIVVPGVAMLVGSFFIPPRGGLGLAIPGAIVTMVGLVLWAQATWGLYATWAYAWALVAPTAVGLGMLLYGLVHRDGELVADGLRTTLVGLGLFLGFALFFEGVIGLSGSPIGALEEILPYAVIVLGAVMVVASLFTGGRRGRGAQPRT